jgi:hypothetical protein
MLKIGKTEKVLFCSSMVARSTYDSENRNRKIAICATYQEPTPRAVLQAVPGGESSMPRFAVMIGNRNKCSKLAEEFSVPWHNIGKRGWKVPTINAPRGPTGTDIRSTTSCSPRLHAGPCPPDTCWKFCRWKNYQLASRIATRFSPASGPYHDAFCGAGCSPTGATLSFSSFLSLDAGNQTINQRNLLSRTWYENSNRSLIKGQTEKRNPACPRRGGSKSLWHEK